MVKETHKVLEQDGHGSRWTFAVAIFSSHKGILHKNNDKAYIYIYICIYIIDNLQLPSFPNSFFPFQLLSTAPLHPSTSPDLWAPSGRPAACQLPGVCTSGTQQLCGAELYHGPSGPSQASEGLVLVVFREKHVVLVPHPPPQKEEGRWLKTWFLKKKWNRNTWKMAAESLSIEDSFLFFLIPYI